MSQLSLYPVTLDGNSIQKKRDEIKLYFENTFLLYEKVFELLKDESVFYKKSELTRHPMIFYFGHTATFFINKLINMKIITKRINAKYESLFAVGVDEMQWDDMDETRYKWPKVSEVRAYRQEVKKLVLELIETLELSLPINEKSPMWIVLMGIEHERIHIETSLVLHRQMPLEYIKNVESFPMCTEDSKPPQNEMLQIKARLVKLGKEKDDTLYAWDNEYGKDEKKLQSFEVSKFLVSNAQYMEFVLDGGYEEKSYWCLEGLEFLRKTGVKYPPFWIQKENNTFNYRTLSQEITMPLSWPVDVNALEAAAFCKYLSKKDKKEYKLPSEAEYRAMCAHASIEDVLTFASDKANQNFAHYASSCPVDKFVFNGIYDVVGNVWQWSTTPIYPFDGFEVHEAYDDFSVPTFDTKHALILGSSWASSGNLIMKHSRYAFRRHFYQNAGFRYVISKNQDEFELKSFDVEILHSLEKLYMDTKRKKLFNHFTKLLAKFCLAKGKILELGCQTGGMSFELANVFDKVEALDFSARYIEIGVALQEKGFLDFQNIKNKKERLSLEELGYKTLAKKVSFWQGDANNLKDNFCSYDCIMVSDILEKITNKEKFFEDILSRLTRDGVLVIVSSFCIDNKILKEKLVKMYDEQFEEKNIQIWRKNEI